MVLCKFYLQGNCRYGDNCKFEHQVRVDFNSAVPTSILRQSQPQQQQHQQQQQPPPQQINADVAVRSVINDMILAEKGGQWLLSSYFPFKGKPPFPGFEDISFEEMRYNFYTAQRNGTIEQHKQLVQRILQQTAMQVRALQNPSREVVDMIKNLFNAPTINNEGGKSGFSFAQAGKDVLQRLQNTNTQPQSHNIFAQANQVLFGQQKNDSIFNNPVKQQPTNSGFVQTPQPVFGFQWSGNNFPQQTPAQSTVFQQSPPQSPSQTNLFQSQQPSNVFQQQPNLQSNIFQKQEQPNIFQLPQQQTNPNIFGGSSTHTENLNRPQDIDESAYSNKDVLTESELNAFQADSFEFGQIPEKPPTKDMCF